MQCFIIVIDRTPSGPGLPTRLTLYKWPHEADEMQKLGQQPLEALSMKLEEQSMGSAKRTTGVLPIPFWNP